MRRSLPHRVDAEGVRDATVPRHTERPSRRLDELPSMRRNRIGPLVVVIVVLGGVAVAVAVLAMAALPTVLALGLGVVALVAGAGTRLRGRWGRGTHAGPEHDPATVTGASRLRWAARWASGPPVDTLPDTRRRVAVVLAEWGVTGEAAEPALLVVTELLSNAVEHGGGPGWLSLELADDAVHVEVRDDAGTPPRLADPDPSQARGRGLQMVDALASEWGWTEDPPGKVVWAAVPTRWPA
jgi:anti-sigma regulatory factor (Ser/Thr protein kinase)